MALIMSAPPGAPTRSPSRLGWLDALRGYAAVVVALFHLAPSVLGPQLNRAITSYFDMGRYGVLLFFLVSGYVIPMSLERHGSLRKFWVGRFFRIYPAYLATIAVIFVVVAADIHRVNQGLRDETATGVLGHATMLSEFFGLRGLIWPFWTLSFEMIFYLIVAGLFVLGLHRLSAWWAAGLVLVAMAGAERLPDALLGADVAARRLTAVVVLLLFTISLLAYLTGRRVLVRVAAVVGIGFVALPLLNGHATKWSSAASSSQAVMLLSVLFAGTVIYRAHHRQLNRWAAAAVLAVVLAGSMLTTWLRTGQQQHLVVASITALAVAVSFAVAFALRHRRVPRLLTWLGEVSYSLYLLHIVVLYVVVFYYPADARGTIAGRIGVGVVFALGTLLAAWAGHRFVERPGQALGRHALTRLHKIFGPEATATPVRTAGGDSDGPGLPSPSEPVRAGTQAPVTGPV